MNEIWAVYNIHPSCFVEDEKPEWLETLKRSLEEADAYCRAKAHTVVEQDFDSAYKPFYWYYLKGGRVLVVVPLDYDVVYDAYGWPLEEKESTS